MSHGKIRCESMLDYDAKCKNESSKLEEAILDNKISKAMQLIRIGSDINFKDDENRTPLMAAVEANNPEMCKYLIKHGAELEVQDAHKKTAYLRAAKLSNDPKVLEVLEESGCNIYARDENNDTALFLAALYNDSIAITKHLLKKGFDPADNDDVYYYTPLMAAAHYGKNLKVIKALLFRTKFDEYDFVDKGGCTALMHSAYHEWDDPEVFWTIYNFLKQIQPGKIKERLFKKSNDGKTMLEIAKEEEKPKVSEAIEKAMKEYDEK